MNTVKNYNCVDVAKFIMSVLVIMIHKPLFENKYEFMNYITGSVICALAVPFFFIASSFFFFKKIKEKQENKKRLIHFEKRLFVLYFIWSIIYIPCVFVKFNSGHYDELTFKILLGQVLIFIKNFFFSQSFVHLWFINTLMLSVAIAYFISKKVSSISTCILCTTVSIAVMLLSNIDGFFKIYSAVIPAVVRNTLEKGLVYVTLGLVAARYEEVFRRRKVALLSLFSFIIMIAVSLANNKAENIVIGTLFSLSLSVCAFFIFILCTKLQLTDSSIFKRLRSYSILMYFSHLLLMSEGFRYVSAITGFEIISKSRLLIFFVTLIFAFLFAVIVRWLSERKGFEKLKLLY